MNELPAREDGWPYAIRYAWASARGVPLPEVAPQRPTARWTTWRPNEDEVMRAEYPAARANGTIAQLAERLQRTPIALMTRARKLGIARRRAA